jgi:hypothetical protein
MERSIEEPKTSMEWRIKKLKVDLESKKDMKGKYNSLF